MKNLIYLLSIVLLSLFLNSCKSKSDLVDKEISTQTKVIYLVRHAEKMLNKSRDPELTKAGKKRAQKLALMLKDENITQIYSTNFLRTKNTALPLSKIMKTEVQIYSHKDENFANSIKSAKANLLIVGHSNSTPTLVNKILGEEKYEQLDEKEYTKLFKVTEVAGKYSCQIIEY